MLSVIRGQPWTLRGQNLLIELYVPTRNRDDYAFQYMDATIRFYGIPKFLRTENRISEIIQNIGHPSDWHRLNPRTFNYDPCYVAVRVKLDVTKPAKYKVIVSVPNFGNMIVCLYYEKIRRIYTYCAGYFHNAEQCPSRSERILTTSDDQGFGLHGGWITQWSRIPMVLVDNQLTRFQGLSSPPVSGTQHSQASVLWYPKTGHGPPW